MLVAQRTVTAILTLVGSYLCLKAQLCKIPAFSHWGTTAPVPSSVTPSTTLILFMVYVCFRKGLCQI